MTLDINAGLTYLTPVISTVLAYMMSIVNTVLAYKTSVVNFVLANTIPTICTVFVQIMQGSQTPKSRKKKRTAGVKKRTFTEKREHFLNAYKTRRINYESLIDV